MADRYNIIFEGEITEGQNVEDVKERMMKLLKIDERAIGIMFAGGPVVVRKDVDQTTGQRYEKVFNAAGAKCRLEPKDTPPDPSLTDLEDWDYAADKTPTFTGTDDSAAEESVDWSEYEDESAPTTAIPAREQTTVGYVETFDGGQMILSNVETIPGREIVEHFGLVSGSTIRAKHVGKDIMASLKNLVGGELKGYTKLLQESREQAIDRMVAQARQLGANAIVNIRFSTSSVAQGAAELYAYGTAVRVV
jgi:uncharacterized protein YbjQ (UPF0145 family)